jgi:hypothetical protein
VPTVKAPPARDVLVTVYCPACRGHYQAIVAAKAVRESAAKGHGYPFVPHPTCRAGAK